jgi:NADH dehydrogenase FAD-containing subunit
LTRQLRSAFPTIHALRRRPGQRHLAQVFQAEVVGVDFGARKIRSDAESFSYDYLRSHGYAGVPQMVINQFGVDTRSQERGGARVPEVE